MKLNLEDSQIEYIWQKLDDPNYVSNGIPNKDVNLPDKNDMTEREQMLFVIKCLKEENKLLKEIAGEKIFHHFQNRPVLETFIKENYLIWGEFNHWEFNYIY